MRVRPARFLFAVMASALLVGPALSPTQSIAQQNIMIRLEAPDGTVSLQGRLMWIQDGFYVLETAAKNTMMVDASRIQCVSDICPN